MEKIEFDFDDLFKIEETEIIKMDVFEYANKAKDLLNHISNEYSKAWTSRRLEEDEYPEESICDKCKGCGTFKNKHTDELDECQQDREYGECYNRFCDVEQFGIEVEAFIEDILQLSYVDEFTTTHLIE